MILVPFGELMLLFSRAHLARSSPSPLGANPTGYNECSPPAWGGRLAAALAMIFKTLRTCKDDDNLLLRETGDWSYGAVQW